jgi:site-specific recombinase XerD
VDTPNASVESKQYALGEFGRFTGKRRVADVSTADVERFCQALQDRVSESTAQGYITTVRSFFNRMVELKKIRLNPVEGVNLARLDQKGRLLFCPPDLRDKLIANAPNEAMEFILYCGFHAGLRKNEIIEARPEWFDLERGSIHIRTIDTFRPKDREARDRASLRECRSADDSQYNPPPRRARLFRAFADSVSSGVVVAAQG